MPSDPSNTKLPTSIDTGENKPSHLEKIILKRRGFIGATLLLATGLTSACSSKPEQNITQEIISFQLACLTINSDPKARANGEELEKLKNDFKVLGILPNENGTVILNKDLLLKKGVTFEYVEVPANEALQGRNIHVENLVITINGLRRYIGRELTHTNVIPIPPTVIR